MTSGQSGSVTGENLLSDAEQQRLYQESEAALKPWQELKGVSRSSQQGILQSRALGAGLEYAESHPYQAGDDIRFLDWRLMAKKGEPFSKWFEPEKQEYWCLVADYSATMRFGTRHSLKAQQACRALGAFALLAQKRQAVIQMMTLATDLKFSALLSGNQLFEQAMAFANQPCPPLSESEVTIDFDVMLESIPGNLSAGTHLIFFSDFHGLESTSQEKLSALSHKFDVTAVFIEDYAERHLPKSGTLRMQSMSQGRSLSMGRMQQSAFQNWAGDVLDSKQQALRACGVRVIPWRTDQLLAELLNLWELSQ